MNRAWEDVMVVELALGESSQSQPLLEQMDLRCNLTPAILSYEGIQYRCMAPGVMETTHLDYLREHLRILSGFCGLLRAFDQLGYQFCRSASVRNHTVFLWIQSPED